MTLTETFLKKVALSISVWVYPREMKTRDGNLKKCRNFASMVILRKYCRSHPLRA